jgi:hypothetical protein
MMDENTGHETEDCINTTIPRLISALCGYGPHKEFILSGLASPAHMYCINTTIPRLTTALAGYGSHKDPLLSALAVHAHMYISKVTEVKTEMLGRHSNILKIRQI